MGTPVTGGYTLLAPVIMARHINVTASHDARERAISYIRVIYELLVN